MPTTEASCCPPPLLRVRVSVPGHPDKFITNPKEVDKAAIDAWAKVHKGNISVKAADSAILSFMRAFGDFFPHAEPMPLELITGEQVRQGIAASPDNTAGLDGVQKGDLAILSPYACDWIAALLNRIEAGAAWPDFCTQGRLAFLSKGGDAASPLDFRKLSILSKVYRLHMALRLKDLAPWIKSWALPCLFAGTCDPAGAEDAWCETSLCSRAPPSQVAAQTSLSVSTRLSGSCCSTCWSQVASPRGLPELTTISTSNYTIATLLLGGLGRFTGTFVASPRDVHLA